MQYDNNKYYYSPTANYPWFLEGNKPDDAIEMTLAMEIEYETGLLNGLMIIPFENGFKMVGIDEVLSSEELEQLNKEKVSSEAKQLLTKSFILETRIFKDLMSSEEKDDFNTWQDSVYAVTQNGNLSMPETPEFITVLLQSISN